MTRDELVASLLAERFGPLPTVLPERRPAARRRRRVLLAGDPADDYMPPRQSVEIAGDVAALVERRFSAGQIAALLGVDVARVRRDAGR